MILIRMNTGAMTVMIQIEKKIDKMIIVGMIAVIGIKIIHRP